MRIKKKSCDTRVRTIGCHNKPRKMRPLRYSSNGGNTPWRNKRETLFGTEPAQCMRLRLKNETHMTGGYETLQLLGPPDAQHGFPPQATDSQAEAPCLLIVKSPHHVTPNNKGRSNR